jgi:hypothetical protein
MEIQITPQYKQHLAYQAINSPDIDVLFFGGGAGGGKSWFVCESRLIRALRFPGYRSFIGREELKRLMQSTYITWNKVCEWHKIPKEDWSFNGQYNYIQFRNGSRIDFLDLKYLPTDPLYERFGSLEYTDGAIEEAGEIHSLAYEVLKSRIGRHKNREFGIHPSLVVTGNPKKNWTYIEFYKPFKEGTLPKNIVFIQSLYYDNKYSAEDYKKQLDQIKDRVTRERLMMGNWEYDLEDNALIKYDSIIDLFTNHVEENGEKYLVIDVARYGHDKSIFHYWEEKKLYKREQFQGLGIDQLYQKAKNISFSERIAYSHIIADDDGVGGGLVDIMRGIKGFIANSVPFDNPQTHKPDNFNNLKSQCAYKLADEINNHRIAIDVQDNFGRDLIITDLEQIKAKDIDKDNKRQIVPKEEIKEILGRSPDDGDCLIMRMWFELSPKTGTTAYQYIPKNLKR